MAECRHNFDILGRRTSTANVPLVVTGDARRVAKDGTQAIATVASRVAGNPFPQEQLAAVSVRSVLAAADCDQAQKQPACQYCCRATNSSIACPEHGRLRARRKNLAGQGAQ